jgi:hypothetical protein
MKALPSYVFAGLGVGLLAVGLAGLVWGTGALTKTIFGIVAIIGVVGIVIGIMRRKGEAAEPHVLRGPDV